MYEAAGVKSTATRKRIQCCYFQCFQQHCSAQTHTVVLFPMFSTTLQRAYAYSAAIFHVFVNNISDSTVSLSTGNSNTKPKQFTLLSDELVRALWYVFFLSVRCCTPYVRFFVCFLFICSLLYTLCSFLCMRPHTLMNQISQSNVITQVIISTKSS